MKFKSIIFSTHIISIHFKEKNKIDKMNLIIKWLLVSFVAIFGAVVALSRNSEFVCEQSSKGSIYGQCWSNRLCSTKDFFCKTSRFGCTKFNQCPFNCIEICVKRADFMIQKVQ